MALAGFLVLLDDVASMMAKVAAAAADDVSAAAKVATAGLDDAAMMTQLGVKKASAIVIDDIPVNAKAVAGNQIDPRRELAVVAKIARGSLMNKAWIVPLAVAVDSFAPFLLNPILMIGGAYLAYEGVHKVIHVIESRLDKNPQSAEEEDFAEHIKSPEQFEADMVKGAIRTDIVMSLEITFIALGAFYPDAPWAMQLFSLALVGIVTTLGIYGFVGGLVKLDDIGLHFAKKEGESFLSRFLRKIGRGILLIAPKFMRALSVIGTVAMIYIGGQLIGHGIPPIEHFYHAVGEVPAGGILKLLSEIVVGFLSGGIIVGGIYAVSGAWQKVKPSK